MFTPVRHKFALREEDERTKPLRSAIIFQNIWRIIGIVSVGFLGGVCLLKLIYVAMALDDVTPTKAFDFTEDYCTWALGSEQLLYVLLVLSFVAILDWFDMGHKDLLHFFGRVAYKRSWPAMLIILVMFLMFLCLVPETDKFILHQCGTSRCLECTIVTPNKSSECFYPDTVSALLDSPVDPHDNPYRKRKPFNVGQKSSLLNLKAKSGQALLSDMDKPSRPSRPVTKADIESTFHNAHRRTQLRDFRRGPPKKMKLVDKWTEAPHHLGYLPHIYFESPLKGTGANTTYRRILMGVYQANNQKTMSTSQYDTPKPNYGNGYLTNRDHDIALANFHDPSQISSLKVVKREILYKSTSTPIPYLTSIPYSISTPAHSSNESDYEHWTQMPAIDLEESDYEHRTEIGPAYWPNESDYEETTQMPTTHLPNLSTEPPFNEWKPQAPGSSYVKPHHQFIQDHCQEIHKETETDWVEYWKRMVIALCAFGVLLWLIVASFKTRDYLIEHLTAIKNYNTAPMAPKA